MRNATPADAGKREGKWLVGGKGDDRVCGVRLVRTARMDEDGFGICEADRVLYVIDGELSVQIGTETFAVGKNSAVMLPAGTPHSARIEAGEAEYLEMLSPFVPGPLVAPADAVPVADAAGYVNAVDPAKFKSFGTAGFSLQEMSSRAMGAKHMMVNLARVEPAGGGPRNHIHAFDQLYFMLEGRMQVKVGMSEFVAEKHDLVFIPAGTVHTNFNPGPGVERHLMILSPEPMQPSDKSVWDFAVDVHEREADLQGED